VRKMTIEIWFDEDGKDLHEDEAGFESGEWTLDDVLATGTGCAKFVHVAFEDGSEPAGTPFAEAATGVKL